MARQHIGNDHLLNRERLGDATLGKLFCDNLGHAEVGERLMLHVLMLLLASLGPPLRWRFD
jgi:hypothetical protein